MGTMIRAEISENNEFYISKHRFYELKHFCLQYPEWKQIYADMVEYLPSGIIKVSENKSYSTYRDTKRLGYLDKITLVEDAAKATDPILAPYILKGVTEGKPYTYLRNMMNIPCGKDYYYALFRKFFWILDKMHCLA